MLYRVLVKKTPEKHGEVHLPPQYNGNTVENPPSIYNLMTWKTKTLEKMWGKGENDGNQNFSLSSKCLPCEIRIDGKHM